MSHISYLRVSTNKQGESGLGIEAQRSAVERYLGAVGGTLSAEFCEVETGRGYAGINRRPLLQSALQYARRHKSILVVAKLDRLTRSARLLLELVEQSAETGLVFCDLPNIPPGPVGKFMLTQLAAVAEFEGGMISQRTKAALAAAKARGVKLGTNGALLAKSRKTEALIKAAALLPHIQAARESGNLTLRDIARHLTAAGIPTCQGGAWHPTTVQRVLSRLNG